MTRTYINPDNTTGIELSLENLTVATITPSQLTANQDNWNPTGLSTAGLIRASTDASRNLTGITAPSARKLLILENVGAFDLVLKHDVTSTAANRFYCPNDADLTLQKDSAVFLEYDTTATRWRVIGGTGSGGGSALTVQEEDGSPIDAATTGLTFPNDSVTFNGHVAHVRQVPYGFIGCQVYASANQTCNDSAILFDSENYDTDSLHDTGSNTGRFTVPTGMGGKWEVKANAQDASGAMNLVLRKNGTNVNGTQTGHISADEGNNVSWEINLAAGDYVEVMAYTSGANHTIYGGSFVYRAQASFRKLEAGRVGSAVGASVYHNTTQSSPSNIAFNSENYDTDGFHDTSSNTSRLTIPSGMSGRYLFTFGGIGPANGDIRLRKNGSTMVGPNWSNASASELTYQGSVVVDLLAGDYVEFNSAYGTGTWGHASAYEAQSQATITRQDTVARANQTYLDAYASAPAGPTKGDLWIPSDNNGPDQLVFNGSVWVPVIRGIQGTLPSDTGFSWVNQGTSTLDTAGPAFTMTTVAGEGGGYRIRVKSAPTPPYTITVFMRGVIEGNGYPGFGICHRESSSGKLYIIHMFADQDGTSAGNDSVYLRVDYWTDANTFNSGINPVMGLANPYAGIWYRIKDDNTNRIYQVSANGKDFLTVYSVARTTNMTANQVGWMGRAHASYGGLAHLISWVES